MAHQARAREVHPGDDGERISRLETTVETLSDAFVNLSKKVERGFEMLEVKFTQQEQNQRSEKARMGDSWWKASAVAVTAMTGITGSAITVGVILIGVVGKAYIDPIRTDLDASKVHFAARVDALKLNLDASRDDHKETMTVLRDAVDRVASRVDSLANNMTAAMKQLDLGLHEVETQFSAADGFARLRSAHDYQLTGLLWGKVFPEAPLPLPYAPPVGIAREHPE